MSEGGKDRNERCGLFFTCELMDEDEQSIAAPDWPKLIEGARWETIALLVNGDSLDVASRAMWKRVSSWEKREEKYRQQGRA